jgi:hypothetical protein
VTPWPSERDFTDARGDGDGAVEALVGMNTGRAHPGRIYDFLLGGKDNFRADREAAERMVRMVPGVVDCARENRAFLGRAVTYLARQGVEQFMDIGSGLPTEPNVHEVAQQFCPNARVVYVDNDPIVVRNAQALLATDDHTIAVRGDLRDPVGIVTHPKVRRHLDFSQPVGVLLVAILHFIPDSHDPARIIRTLRDTVATGSYLVISHGLSDTTACDAAANQAAAKEYSQLAQPVTLRTHDQMKGLLTGWDQVEPGLVPVSTWRPDGRPRGVPVPVLAGVARRPTDRNGVRT